MASPTEDQSSDADLLLQTAGRMYREGLLPLSSAVPTTDPAEDAPGLNLLRIVDTGLPIDPQSRNAMFAAAAVAGVLGENDDDECRLMTAADVRRSFTSLITGMLDGIEESMDEERAQ